MAVAVTVGMAVAILPGGCRSGFRGTRFLHGGGHRFWLGTRSGAGHLEEGDGVLKYLGLGGQFLRGGGHLLGGGSILLDDLVEFLERLVDLAHTDALLALS